MNASRTLQVAALLGGATLSISSMAATFMNGQSVYGQHAPSPAPSARQVDTAKTQRVAVRYGETVTFVGEGGQKFAWTFDALDRQAVPLSKIAPAGFATKPVTVYVGHNPSNSN